MKKWLKRLGYLVLFLFVLLNIVSAFHAYKFTHFYPNAEKPKKAEEMTKSEVATSILFGVKYPKSKVVDSLNLPHETITLKTDDNLKLEAWLINKNDTINNKTVIMFHGHGSSKSAIITEAKAFSLLGYSVFMVDFRAHGNSEGTICTIGSDEAKDVKAAFEYAQQKNKGEIILWGISMGAASILKAIDEFELKPTKVICEMPFARLYDAVKGRLRIMKLPEQPFASLLTFWGGSQQGFWAFNYNPEDYAQKLTCPILLQWGVNDSRVTKDETTRIFMNLNSPKKLVEYEFSGHESLCKKENAKWISEIIAFLDVKKLAN